MVEINRDEYALNVLAFVIKCITLIGIHVQFMIVLLSLLSILCSTEPHFSLQCVVQTQESQVVEPGFYVTRRLYISFPRF